jgi:hypothetical protein
MNSEILTQDLPSGYNYPFTSIGIKPMKFGEILEYLELVPDKKKNPIENYYFNYCLIKDDDPNIGQLLLNDMEYILFMKKAITIADNLEYSSSYICPKCGNKIPYRVSLAGVRWNKMDPDILGGLTINFSGQLMYVRLPKVDEFMNIFTNYRVYKKVTDMRIIKLIALFEQSQMYLQRVENLVVNATHKDIATLIMLEQLYYDFIDPIELHCDQCSKMYVPTEQEIFNAKQQLGLKEDEELPMTEIEKIKNSHGGIAIGLEDLVAEFFRDLIENNRPSQDEVKPGKIC